MIRRITSSYFGDNVFIIYIPGKSILNVPFITAADTFLFALRTF